MHLFFNVRDAMRANTVHTMAEHPAPLVEKMTGGTVLDEIGSNLLTVPVFLPVVLFCGFDEIGFGGMIAVTIQMGYISAPFGITLFTSRAPCLARSAWVQVYREIMPFLLLQFVGMLICVIFPGLVIRLPNLMR